MRKAQIQHRARKADYTKQLEADIETIRAQIDGADRARQALRSENQTLRSQLASGGHHRQQQQQQHQFATAATAAVSDGGFYTAPPTSYPHEEADAMMLYQQTSSSTGYGGGFDVHGAAGLDSTGCFDGLGADLSEFLGSGSGAYYDDSGSPAYASSSRGSSGGMYGSPQYMDSGSSTPFLLPEMGSHTHANHHQVMDYMTGFQ